MAQEKHFYVFFFFEEEYAGGLLMAFNVSTGFRNHVTQLHLKKYANN